MQARAGAPNAVADKVFAHPVPRRVATPSPGPCGGPPPVARPRLRLRTSLAAPDASRSRARSGGGRPAARRGGGPGPDPRHRNGASSDGRPARGGTGPAGAPSVRGRQGTNQASRYSAGRRWPGSRLFGTSFVGGGVGVV